MPRSTSRLAPGTAGRKRSRLAAGLALCVAFTAARVTPAAAASWYLNALGTGQYPTIQAALSSPLVMNGDLIILSDGTYAGPGNRDISFLGKNVTVRSTWGDDLSSIVVIDCQGSAGTPHRGFVFNNGETSSAKLLGIQIENGYVSNADGGGIWIGAASPTIDYCEVRNCTAANGNGGGIACIGPGNPTLIRCSIYDNTANGIAAGNGGGLYTTTNAPTLGQFLTLNRDHALLSSDGSGGNGGAICCTNAQLSDVIIGTCDADGHGGALAATASTGTNFSMVGSHSAGAGGGAWLSGSTLVYAIITGNASTSGNGGGVSASATTNIHASTISGNRAASGGGFSGADTFIDLSVIWGNCASSTGHEMNSGNNVVISCCCVDATGMNGVVGVTGPLILTNPHFCAPQSCSLAPIGGGDYGLNSQSPCLPANNACLLLIGAATQDCATDAVEPNAVALIDDLRGPAVSRGPIELECSLARFGHARVTVHDVSGRCVATLADGSFAAGRQTLRWTGRDDHGGHLAAGVYFARLATSASVRACKLVRLGE